VHAVIGAGHDREPLAEYAILASVFAAASASAGAAALRRGALSAPIPLRDLLLLGLATARLSHLVTREKVAKPLRALFTEVGAGGEDRARGQGLTRTLGELLTCPHCFGIWSAAALSIAYAFAPRPSRMVASIRASSMLGDRANAQLARAQTDGPQPRS
jgi:hypothetical protein